MSNQLQGFLNDDTIYLGLDGLNADSFVAAADYFFRAVRYMFKQFLLSFNLFRKVFLLVNLYCDVITCVVKNTKPILTFANGSLKL